MRILTITILAAFSFAACRGGGTDPFLGPAPAGAGGGATSATLSCPDPEVLPEGIVIEADGFNDPDAVADAQAAAEADPDPGPNHLILDFVGNPGTPQFIEGHATYGVNALVLNGIEGETVSLWTPTSEGQWVLLGRTQTEEEGLFRFDIDEAQQFEVGEWPVYVVVEGDATCAKGGVFVYPEGTQVIVSDIDETMSLSDEEMINEIGDPDYVAKQRPLADEMMRTYAEKGYKVMFVTARPFHLRMLTRKWLDRLDYPFTYIETASTFVFGSTAREYKRAALNSYIDLGFEVVRAYGNADSDFDAYADVGVPEDRAFSIGALAGYEGTTAIQGEGYEDHLADVRAFPDADQPF